MNNRRQAFVVRYEGPYLVSYAMTAIIIILLFV